MTGLLDLPPSYRAIVLREHRDSFVHAQAIAAEAGAGTLVWVRRFESIEVAVVLEPDEPLAGARRALYAVMNAAGDALAAHCPPEKPLSFAWPDTILLDGGVLGGVRMAWPAAAAEVAVPDWLVCGLVVRMAVAVERNRKSESHPLDVTMARGTSLEIEGFETMDAAGLIGSFARHLMAQFDRWEEKGFVPLGEQFLSRLPEENAIRFGLDSNGDLLRQGLATRGAELDRRALRDALRRPHWLDPGTGEPWL